jgi:putative FmdB family regulatory protein
MPIYEYQCGNCGGTSEVIEGVIRQEQSVICPRCGSRTMTRLPSRGVGTPKRGSSGGATCCGRQERCERPPCTTEERCRR